MTYLDRINHLWNLRRNGALRSSDHELAMFLLDSFNRLGWKNPMAQANALTCGLLSISEKTLIASRNGLKQDGLIDFKSGKKGQPTLYFLSDWKITPTNSSAFDRENDRENDRHHKSKSEEQEKEGSKANAFVPAAGTAGASVAVGYSAVVDLFHRLCPSHPRLRGMTDQRQTVIRSRWQAALKARQDPMQRFEELFRLAEGSDFLAGRKGRRALGFDWLLKPANAQKVLEGNYANDQQLKRDPIYGTPRR